MAKLPATTGPVTSIKEKFAEMEKEVHALKAEVLILTNTQTTIRQQMKVIHDNLLLSIGNTKRLTDLYDSNFKRIQALEDGKGIKPKKGKQ